MDFNAPLKLNEIWFHIIYIKITVCHCQNKWTLAKIKCFPIQQIYEKLECISSSVSRINSSVKHKMNIPIWSSYYDAESRPPRYSEWQTMFLTAGPRRLLLFKLSTSILPLQCFERSSVIRYLFAFTVLESERKKRISATPKWREFSDPNES